jgi:dTDP-4-amino-4,6-dideoxygalactose transaminase
MIEHSRPTVGADEQKAVKGVLKSKYLAEGQTVERFEKKLSDYIGAKGGVATCTGTSALHLALLSLGLKQKDEVIIPSYVCRSVLNAILYTSATPVLCDVNKEDYNISFDDAKKKITTRTRAIIVPHMYGCPAEIDKFKRLGIFIIEDCAHSIGAEYKGKKVGAWGDLSIFSFEGTKYITTGEGGMVLANSGYLLNKIKKLKEPDSRDYKVKYTYRTTNIQAAIGIVQLSRLTEFIEKRIAIAKNYARDFSGSSVNLPVTYSDRTHIFHRFMIQIDGDIHAFMSRCYKRGVKVKQPVKPYALHEYLNLPAKHFPNADFIMKSAVSIPIYPSLTKRNIDKIIGAVIKECRQKPCA